MCKSRKWRHSPRGLLCTSISAFCIVFHSYFLLNCKYVTHSYFWYSFFATLSLCSTFQSNVSPPKETLSIGSLESIVSPAYLPTTRTLYLPSSIPISCATISGKDLVNPTVTQTRPTLARKSVLIIEDAYPYGAAYTPRKYHHRARHRARRLIRLLVLPPKQGSSRHASHLVSRHL